MTTKQKYAYLAGMIDGEGFFSLHHLKKTPKSNGLGYYSGIITSIHISNTNIEMMKFIQEIVAKIIKDKIKLYKENRLTITGKQPYKVMISGVRRCRKIIKKIYPFLIAKKKQAKLMMESCEREKWLMEENHRLNGRKRDCVETNTQGIPNNWNEDRVRYSWKQESGEVK